MMEYKRISADCHIDLCWMPPDLFVTEASPAMKERMPFVTDGPDGPYWTCKNGTSFGLKNGVGPSGAKYVPGAHDRADLMAATNLYEDGKNDIRRVSTPELRIKDMERDGVFAQVVYSPMTTQLRIADAELRAALHAGASEAELARLGARGDRSLSTDAGRKVLALETTLAEALLAGAERAA